MARIVVLEAIAGDDFSWSPGDVVDLAEEEAVKWADGYRAQRVDPPAAEPGPESAEPPKASAKRAAAKPAETAAERSRGGGRRRRTETRDAD